MAKLAEKLSTYSSAQPVESEEDLRVEFDDQSPPASDARVQEVFSLLVKFIIVWPFFQMYLYLNTSIPNFENFVYRQVSAIGNLFTGDFSTESVIKNTLPAPDAGTPLSPEILREIIKNPTITPQELIDKNSAGIRRR